jgi:hypothetical protein
MSLADDFINYCTQTLEGNFGTKSNAIINKILSNKNLNETSNANDFKEFINLIEHEIGVPLGKNKAMDICNNFRNKAIELIISKQATDVFNAFRTEPYELNISIVSGENESLKVHLHITKPVLGQKCQSTVSSFLDKFFKKSHNIETHQNNPVSQLTKPLEIMEKQKSPEFNISDKIEDFLMKNTLPSESDISRQATLLTMKYGGDIKKVKKDIIEKVKVNIRDKISNKAINGEIDNFLARYPHPTQVDIDAFINYINLLWPNSHTDGELRQLIEKEWLHRKFSESRTIKETSELDWLINIIKTNNDKRKIIEEVQKKELSYLIKDDSGISNKVLEEFIALMIPIGKKGRLERPNLKSKIKRIHSR